MLLPLVVLSVGAVGAGYLGVEATGRPFHNFLAPVFEHTFSAAGTVGHISAAHVGFWAAHGLEIASIALTLSALLAAYVCFVRQPWIPALARTTFTRLYAALWNKWYVDEAYAAAIAEPTRATGRLCVALDDYVVDGLIWVVTAIPRGFGYLCRVVQSGMLQGYALSIVAGIAVILWFAL